MGDMISQPMYEFRCSMCERRVSLKTEEEVNDHINKCSRMAETQRNSLRLSMKPKTFKQRNRELRAALARIKTPWQQGAVSLQFDRDSLLLQSYERLYAFTEKEIRSELKLSFSGEVINDAGGAVKEWLSTVNEGLLSQQTCLYRFTATETVAYRFQPCLPESALWLAYLHGMIIGKALLEGVPLRCPLSSVHYKKLLDQPLVIEDLMDVDRQLCASLRFMHENDVSSVFFNQFIVEETVPGQQAPVRVELCAGGSEVTISEENKVHYISLTAEWHLVKHAEQAFEALRHGFYKVVPLDSIAGLTADELELAVCGLPEIDIDDWQRHTEYRGEFTRGHTVVRGFWRLLSTFSQEDLSLLLKFVMGTTRLPVEGFKTLRTLRGDSARFTLEPIPYSKSAKYPRAHTCFNRLDLPLYPSFSEMKESVVYAIRNHSEGFGIE